MVSSPKSDVEREMDKLIPPSVLKQIKNRKSIKATEPFDREEDLPSRTRIEPPSRAVILPSKVKKYTDDLNEEEYVDLLNDGTPHDDTPSVTHFGMHPGAVRDVEDVGQWYTEKNRISIAKIQMPVDDFTLYVKEDQEIDHSFYGWVLVGLVFLMIGAFL